MELDNNLKSARNIDRVRPPQRGFKGSLTQFFRSRQDARVDDIPGRIEREFNNDRPFDALLYRLLRIRKRLNVDNITRLVLRKRHNDFFDFRAARQRKCSEADPAGDGENTEDSSI